MTPEQFLELGDLLPEPLFLVSGDGRIRVANRAALRRERGQRPRTAACRVHRRC